jgi:hypothetical protein
MKEESILLREEVFRIVGAAMTVLNELGHGLHVDTKVIEGTTDHERGQMPTISASPASRWVCS